MNGIKQHKVVKLANCQNKDEKYINDLLLYTSIVSWKANVILKQETLEEVYLRIYEFIDYEMPKIIEMPNFWQAVS